VPNAIGLDVGGTKIAGVRVGAGAEVLERRSVSTPAEDEEAILDAVLGLARDLLDDDVLAIGVGAAGIVDDDDVVRYSPNLAYRNLPLGRAIRDETGLPSIVDNDANVAAWGEFRAGAARGVDDMLLVTVGTGIGGGIISGGRLCRGAHGFAAEIGHIIVEPGGPLCGCGNHGCWEQVASGTAVERAGARAAQAHPDSLLGTLSGADPTHVTGRIVTEAARRDDAAARAVVEEIARRLGEGIAGLVNVLDPALVVVGGGAAEAGDLMLGPARAAFRAAVEAPEHRPAVPIVAAELGNEAGCIGAALLALEEAHR
jgi:glucokinase